MSEKINSNPNKEKSTIAELKTELEGLMKHWKKLSDFFIDKFDDNDSLKPESLKNLDDIVWRVGTYKSKGSDEKIISDLTALRDELKKKVVRASRDLHNFATNERKRREELNEVSVDDGAEKVAENTSTELEGLISNLSDDPEEIVTEAPDETINEELLKEGVDLKLQLNEISSQLETLTEQLEANNAIGDLTDLLLEANSKRIEIETLLETFLNGARTEEKDLDIISAMVGELLFLKDVIFDKANNLGNGVEEVNNNSELESNDDLEKIENQINSAIEKISKLKERLSVVFGPSYVSKPISVAEDTIALIQQSVESDPNIAKKNKQKYLKKLLKMVAFAEEELSKSEEEKEIEDKSEEAEESVSDTDSREFAENSESGLYIEKLTEFYKNADEQAFVLESSGERIKYKNLKQIEQEIFIVLEHAGFDEDKVAIFKRELKGVKKEIASLTTALKAKDLKGKARKEKLNNRKEAYSRLLSLVSQVLVVPGENFENTKEKPETEAKEVAEEGGIEENREEKTKSKEEIESLFDLYKAADKRVFIRDDNKDKFKRFPEVANDINLVLAHAHIPEEKIGEFMERVHMHHWSLIKELNSKLIGDMQKPEYKLAREALVREIDTKYQELLQEVADLLNGKVVEIEEQVIEETIDSAGTVESSATSSEELLEYRDNRKELLQSISEAKKAYKEAEERYNLAFQKHFYSQTWSSRFNRMESGVKNLLGLNPNLPTNLKNLKRQLGADRQKYADLINSALEARAKVNKEKSEENVIKTKMAFVKKFIIKPNTKMLEEQEAAALTLSQRSSLAKIMKLSAKHKWLTRVAIVSLAGAAGAASGGVGAFVAGATFKASRMAVSALAGGAAGGAAAAFTERKVKKAEQNLLDLKNELGENFSLDNLHKGAEKYEAAQRKIKTAKTQQKAATVSSAVAAGGLYGYLDGVYGTGSIDTKGGFAVETEPVEADDKDSNLSEKDIALNLSDLPEDIDIKLPNEELVADTFKNEPVEKEETTLSDFVDAVKDLAGVKSPEEELAKSAAQEPVNNIYEVKKGDTLSDIVDKHFDNKLSNLSEEDRYKVVYELLDRVQGDKDFKTALESSLGMRSNDIDLIYAGEKLDLSALDKELDKVISEYNNPKEDLVEVTETRVTDLPEPITLPALEKNDQVEVFVRPDIDYVPDSGQYLSTPEYREYINQVFGDEKSLLKTIDKEAGLITNSTYGFLDTIFGVSYKDPYEVMSSMTLAEIEEIQGDMLNNFSSQEARVFCAENNLKYETYLKWQEQIESMKTNLEYQPNTTLKDLFSRYVIENKVAEFNKNK